MTATALATSADGWTMPKTQADRIEEKVDDITERVGHLAGDVGVLKTRIDHHEDGRGVVRDLEKRVRELEKSRAGSQWIERIGTAILTAALAAIAVRAATPQPQPRHDAQGNTNR